MTDALPQAAAPAEAERNVACADALPFSGALRRLLARQDLDRAETEALFGRLMDGAFDEAQKAALLVALAMKGESPEEIAGAAAAMRRRVVAIPHSRELAIDTCGTGGDGRGTFNISTAAALVAAAGGAVVAKHGNRSVSSRSGSADVLAALGVALEVEPEAAGRALDDIGIAFLFAPRLHPAMREVMPVRRALGVRTVFNLLGPLTNPAGAQAQVLGVFARDRVEVLAQVLLALGTRHALVVHGSDGLDEITTTGETFVAEVRDGRVTTWTLVPEDLGLRRVPLSALQGGTPEDNARRMEALLAGEVEGALADVVALNAAAALVVAGCAADLAGGLATARELLAGGAGARKLADLRDHR
jgi:anthranilate phosphoribosyltransferase